MKKEDEINGYTSLGKNGSLTYFGKVWDCIYIFAHLIKDKFLPHTDVSDVPIVTLNYCINGRCEVKMPGGRYIYMEPGCICMNENVPKDGYEYPSGNYTGIEIAIDIEEFTRSTPKELSAYGADAKGIKDILRQNHGTYFMRLSDHIQNETSRLFEKMREKSAKPAEYRFYVLSVFYEILNASRDAKTTHYVTKGQRQIANAVEEMITQNISKKFKVEEMSRLYGVSPSALKKYFESVYGMPISHYIKKYRMEHASKLLCNSRISVGEIAASCGYSNHGKFSEAFKSIMNISPLEYRRRNYIKQKEEESA